MSRDGELLPQTKQMIAPIRMNLSQIKEAAAMGAYIEFVYNGLIGSYKEFTLAGYGKAIRAIGPEHCILASDMGQMANPVHTVALKQSPAGLMKDGITQAEIDRMARLNPAAVLDLN